MRRLSLALILAAVCLVPCAARAARFEPIDGQPVEGDLQSADAKGVLSVKSAAGAVNLAAADLMRIQFADREPDEPADGVVAYLPGGGRICGTLAKSSQTAIEVQSNSLGLLALPLEKVLAIEFRRLGEQPKDAARMRALLLANETKNDVTFSVNGDQMPGILVSFERETLVIRTPAGEMPLKTARLFGISFAAKERPPLAPSLLASVRCADGSLVTGTLEESGSGTIKLSLVTGANVSIPAAGLIDLTFRQGKLVYLSDLKPQSEKYVPFFGGDHTWPCQRDQNYDRSAIRLAGKAYRKGLGTFSGTTLTYDLAGQFQKFTALVGIDDADTNHQGNVTVRVLADGKEVFQKAELTQKTGPVKVELPMAGVKTLQLVVEFGGNMHFGDLTDWADARLIR